MAGRWSSNDVVAEYRDLQAHAMAVDCTGQCALLAGKRCIALVDLNNPSENVKKVQRQSKWEISAVQWNPHVSHQNVFVSACNQRADVCVWTDTNFRKQGSLKAHTRVISDLDWSPDDSNLLATCSVDTFTYLWDTRDFRKPSVCLEAVAGVSQVKWNKVNSNLLATTHDGDIRVWDPRKGTSPVIYIAGHLSKIHGLDWNPTSEVHLATSSQDCTVKFWDVSNPRQPEMKLPSGSPVWRARHTPFGRGMITVVVPQLRRGENSLFLWHLGDTRQPVHTFVGHTDVVLEFQWRKQPDGESGDQQLVTWSKDQSLRLWKIDTQMQKLCGHEIPGETDGTLATMFDSDQVENLVIPEVSTTAMTTSTPSVGDPVKKPNTLLTDHTPPNSLGSGPQELRSPQQPRTLQQEFELVNVFIPNVKVEEMDAIGRTFTVSAMSGKHLVQLTMNFPENYPTNAPPNFQFGMTTTLDKTLQTKLIKVLRDTSLNHVKHSRSCIEPCLRQLVSNLETLTQEERKSPDDSNPPYPLQQNTPSFLPLIPTINTIHDSSVPFPRTSGARFCGAGFLVCFTRKSVSENSNSFGRKMSSASDLTPRAMAALSAFGRPGIARSSSGSRPLYSFAMARSPPSDGTSISNYYQFREKKRQRSKRLKDADMRQGKESVSPIKKQIKTGPVIIYNIDCLLPIQKQLAENYVIDSSDVPGMCRKNAVVAAAAGRKDLVQVWSLAELATGKTLRPALDPDIGAPWAYHPFGRRLLKSLINHYSSIYDVQTLAMLCCTYGCKNKGQRPQPQTPAMTVTKSSVKSPPDLTINNNNIEVYPSSLSPVLDATLNPWPIAKVRRSNSWSDIVEDFKFGEEPKDPVEVERELHEQNCRVIESGQETLYDQFMKAYADILYRWDLLDKRAEVLKYVSIPAEPHTGVEFNNECQNCHKEARGPQCWHCKGHVFQCSICHIVVKGTSNFCLACGHGGHSMHMQEWFKTHKMCPTGCGCNCLENNPMVDET